MQVPPEVRLASTEAAGAEVGVRRLLYVDTLQAYSRTVVCQAIERKLCHGTTVSILS